MLIAVTNLEEEEEEVKLNLLKLNVNSLFINVLF